MLQLPEESVPFRILAIDPGTDTMGVALFDVETRSMGFHVPYIQTWHGSRLMSHLPSHFDAYGGRYQRLRGLETHFVPFLLQARPHVVICEDNYMGKFADAFAGLVESVEMIRRSVFLYDPSMLVETVDAASAKLAVGAPSRGGGKEAVIDANRHINFNLPHGVTSASLDSHSNDALAIGYYRWLQLYKRLGGSCYVGR